MKLSLGYDVGKGFVIGEEEVSKLIDRLVDNENILGHLKNVSETSRLECIRELGKWSELALRLKTIYINVYIFRSVLFKYTVVFIVCLF